MEVNCRKKWVSSPKKRFKWLSEVSTIYHLILMTLYISRQLPPKLFNLELLCDRCGGQTQCGIFHIFFLTGSLIFLCFRAQFSDNRSIFNTPNARLMNASLLKGEKNYLISDEQLKKVFLGHCIGQLPMRQHSYKIMGNKETLFFQFNSILLVFLLPLFFVSRLILLRT